MKLFSAVAARLSAPGVLFLQGQLSTGALAREQLAKLLTVLIRQDRFVEGGLNSAFEVGLLTGIARRADELVNG